MGQAFDRDGNLLGEAEGDTRREVLKHLEKMHPAAHEIRIKALERKLLTDLSKESTVRLVEVLCNLLEQLTLDVAQISDGLLELRAAIAKPEGK
jgi:hypothetical protein